MPFGVEKLEWCGYDSEKRLMLFVLTQSMNVTDTALRHRPRLCIASRGKKVVHVNNIGEFTIPNYSKCASRSKFILIIAGIYMSLNIYYLAHSSE